MELVIASKNVHKIREMRAMLKEKLKWDFLSLLDFPDYHPPAETGKTFEENALLKAEHAATTLKKWVLADDSGLVVPALNGAPGVFSARFAGESATDRDNRLKLLHLMNHIEDSQRQGYFECCLALASPEGTKKIVRGICEGTITREEKGSSGFGYDSIFMKYDYHKTFAEIEEELKNRISHRRKAVDKLLLLLESAAVRR